MSDYENKDHHEESGDNAEQQQQYTEQGQHESNDQNDSNEFAQHQELTSPENQPSAPPSDDNGYIVVPPTPQSSIDREALESQPQQQPSVQHDIVVAEADSSTAVNAASQPKTERKQTEKVDESSKSFLCPYYLLACDKLSKVEVPEKARDLLLWSNPKVTGAVFGSILVLLVSLATFSLFTVIGSLLLVASTALGAYRFYLAVVFRIKGTYDDTFDKLSAFTFALPKERVQRVTSLLENDLNRFLNKLKSVLIWDSISNSAILYIGFYLVYCLGSWFNTLTLLILIHVSVFTIPKVYQVYKKPIDQGIETATVCCHQAVKQ